MNPRAATLIEKREGDCVFAFDCYLRAVARIPAASKDEALVKLRELLCAADCEEVAAVITEATMLGGEEGGALADDPNPVCFEVVHPDDRIETQE